MKWTIENDNVLVYGEIYIVRDALMKKWPKLKTSLPKIVFIYIDALSFESFKWLMLMNDGSFYVSDGYCLYSFFELFYES